MLAVLQLTMPPRGGFSDSILEETVCALCDCIASAASASHSHSSAGACHGSDHTLAASIDVPLSAALASAMC
jgi:hypothetical protein